ncbi:phosphoribosylglycinamide formyltransferase [Sphingomonas piscis]|uniref:Phosphoribosylglycinamide formyltransferase n=1 Tax=Sphingomonas piscis TaxID=2714943 RepID=A0A6G7YST7_9SPHN|nr:phosphoribosylglycinamide formyltransferase [Sphingomonas piscis]QIK79803.1 phosphoribosylglycinamide formyltransferase [Sphingomonas piscis]
MADRAKVAVLLSGRGSNMAALLYAAKAADCPFRIALVSGDKPQAPGLLLAEAEGVPVLRLSAKELGREAFFGQLDDKLREAGADYIALAGFMRILPADFVGKWTNRILNIHPSLLPKYKGLDTHQKALDAGDRVAGCSVHIVTPELDDGPILAQTEVAVLPDDSAETLAARVLIAEHQLYPRALAGYVSRELDPSWIEQKVGELALELPETRSKTSHGSPAWRVGSESSGKFFAIMWDRHHGEDSIGVLVKCGGQDEMAHLTESEPDIYFRPAYYGPSDWIGIRLDRQNVDWDHVAEWLRRSWSIVAPPRLTKLMRAAETF